MKIGLFCDQYYPVISGVVVSMKNLYETLESMGHECYIVTCNKLRNHEFDKEILSKRIIFIGKIDYPFEACKDYHFSIFDKHYVKRIGELNLDVIHVNSEFNISKIARKVHKKYNTPVVYTLHTDWTNYFSTIFPVTGKIFKNFYTFLLRNLFTKKLAAISDKVILPTEKMRQYLKTYGIDKNKTTIIPTGIDMQRFEDKNIDFNEVENLKEKYNLKNKKVYMFLGRLAKEKNIPLIIRAFNEAFKNDNDKVLLIVGGGPVYKELKDEVVKLNIKDKVIFTDMIPIEKVPTYYRLAFILLNASTSETQGLTYVEAMASKVPVLAQKDPCLNGVIVDNKNSFLFDGFADFVKRLKELDRLDNDKLNQIKEEAYLTSRDYTKETFAKKVEQVYIEVINKNKD